MEWMKGIVLLLFVSFTGILAQCPPPSLILPCNCSENMFYFVKCANIYDMEVLVKVFDRSVDRQFTNFALYESSIMYLPAVSLSTKQFTNIMIVNSTFTAFFDTDPGTDNQIKTIILMNVRFQRGVGWNLFKNLKKLSLFISFDTEIKSLGKSFVQNMTPELTKLNLFNAKVKKVYPNAFHNLKKLQVLQITNSFVKELKRTMFATPSILQEIDFSGNQIELLPDDLFSNMPQLENVKLTNNKISSVPKAVFGNVYDKLMNIFLENNPLKCDCSVKWFVVKSRRIVTGQCDSPDDKKGQSTLYLKASDFDYCRKRLLTFAVL